MACISYSAPDCRVKEYFFVPRFGRLSGSGLEGEDGGLEAEGLEPLKLYGIERSAESSM